LLSVVVDGTILVELGLAECLDGRTCGDALIVRLQGGELVQEAGRKDVQDVQ